MFGASSSLAPTVQLRRSAAPTVEPRAAATTTAASEVAGSFASRASVMGAVAVVAGASAVMGGRLLYAAAASSSPASPSPSWWSRLVRRLPLLGRRAAAADDDEDDDFASGTGAANLFDAEKSKARQELLRGQAKGPAVGGRRTGGFTGVATTASAAAPKNAATSSQPVTKTTASAAATGGVESTDMADREQHIKLIRALLEREAGIAYDDEEDASSTSSDPTDVSLNYHLATAMEASARDELLMAFAAFEEASGGDVYGSSAPVADTDEAAELHANIMVRTLEYLDMSNEREKLRQRRIALHRADGRSTPVSSVDADEEHDGDGEEEEEGDAMDALYRRFAAEYASGRHGGDEHDEDEDDYGDYPSAMERQARRFESMMLGSNVSRPSVAGAGHGMLDEDDSVLRRILGQRSAAASMVPTSTRRRHGADGDMMEDGWGEAEDDAEEAEFMAYLQQQDNAPHFYSREGMRQARRDPGNDVRVVGMDDDALFGGADEAEWEDEDDEDDGEEEDEEEDEEGVAIPWSRRDKADFERELFARIRQLAARTALTVDMAEQEVAAAEARKENARAQRRQKASAPPAPAPPSPAAAETRAAAATGAGSRAAEAEEEDEWEDEADWEDA